MKTNGATVHRKHESPLHCFKALLLDLAFADNIRSAMDTYPGMSLFVSLFFEK